MESVNRMALELVDEAIDFAEELAVGVYELDNEATVLDFGVDFAGGIEAGLMLAEIQTGGLATVQTRMDEVAGAPLPHVELSTDHPGTALLCSQKAGWELSVEEFEGLGSGPARAQVAEETEFDLMAYRDTFDFAVLAVESEVLPTAAVAEQVAELADVPTSSVFLPAFRTASIAGGVSMAARAAELAVFRLMEEGYDPGAVLTATGSAPVAPVAGSEPAAMARTNDALAYGGQVHLTVEDDVEDPEAVASSATAAYDRPFAEVFADADWDLHEVDPDVFAPAQVTLDVVGGPTHAVGEVNEDRLAESFGL